MAVPNAEAGCGVVVSIIDASAVGVDMRGGVGGG